MAKIQLLLCFTVLFASISLLDVVSATLRVQSSAGDIEAPKTLKDVEPYTVKVVMVFVSDLEKKCPQTSRFKLFFDRLRAYARFVCPLKRFDQTYESDMKAKAGSLLQTISSFAVGKIRAKIQEEKTEAINNLRMMKTIAGKILGGGKESDESMTLTAEQQKEIKEGILKWETVITRIAETMKESETTTSSSSSSSEASMSAKGSSSKSSGSESSSFKDTTGSSSSNSGSPSGSPKNKPSASKDESKSAKGTSFKDTTGGSKITPSGSPKSTESGSKTSFKDTTGKSSSSGSPKSSPSMETSSKDTSSGSKTTSSGSSKSSPSDETSSKETTSGGKTTSKGETSSSTSGSSTSTESTSQKSTTTVTEVEAQTSKEIMTFIMNLEKKCPQKEEYKSFFEKLKTTMTGSAGGSPRRKRVGLLYGIKHAAGKLGEAMQFMRARIGIRSAQVKQSLENYQAEVLKAVEELDAIHQKIVSENKNKQSGSMTITSEQQVEIKQTITRWEKVTTQFVETAIQSESSSSSSSSSSSASSSSSSGEKKMQEN